MLHKTIIKIEKSELIYDNCQMGAFADFRDIPRSPCMAVCTVFAARRLSTVRPTSDTLPLASRKFGREVLNQYPITSRINEGSARVVPEQERRRTNLYIKELLRKNGAIDPTGVFNKANKI